MWKFFIDIILSYKTIPPVSAKFNENFVGIFIILSHFSNISLLKPYLSDPRIYAANLGCLNDGKYLIQTIKDLYKFHPNMGSLSIVPVGLTKHRNNLPILNRVSPNYARKMVEYVDELNVKYKNNNEHPFIFL